MFSFSELTWSVLSYYSAMSLSSQFTTTVSGGTFYDKILDSIVFIETLQT